MQFTSTLVALLLGATAVAATPSLSRLAKRDNPCLHGNNQCSNGQDQKDDAAACVAKVQQTTYVAGGDSSGVCTHHMGLDVYGNNADGSPCTVSGQELQNGYYQIMNAGCQTCGEVAAPAGGNCNIAINYVEGCKEAGHE